MCAQAAPIGAGSFAGLTNPDLEFDHDRIDVPAGQRLEVTATVPQDPNLSGFLLLFADDGSGWPCDSFLNVVASAGLSGVDTTTSMARSASRLAPATFYLQVQSFGVDCMAHDLDLVLTPDPCATAAPRAWARSRA